MRGNRSLGDLPVLRSGSMLCPKLIGREGEVRRLRDRVTGLAGGHGGLVVIAGGAGAGKSRLLHETTTGEDVLVLSGRCVPGDSPVPYRPFVEAFLGALRGRPLPVDASLHGFERQLARLVPSWDVGAPADDSPVLLGEAVVRLLGVLSLERPCVLVLEDLHWADPETLDTVRYLGDSLAVEGLCVGTCRPVGAAAELLHGLDRRHPDAVVRVGPLDDADVARMIGACLGSEPPAGLREFVLAHSEGSPFLVEELLAGLIAAGALLEDDGRWEIDGPLNPTVPASLRDSIGRRLDSLDPTARRVLGAAALLGRAFDWELLPGVAEVDGRAAVDALRAGVREQLIEAVDDGFRFRHALTREAVLADLLPPERHDLAERAWPAIELANPGLPGSSCLLAADLAEAAGDRGAASSRLLESARRALSGGALATAEVTARRAQALAAGDPAAALDADELLLQVLAAAGKSGEALALGRVLAEHLAATEVEAMRQTDLLIAVVRAAASAGDDATARVAVEEARRIADAAGSGVDPALLARIDAVAAEVALDRAELEEAERCGRRAIDAARATDQPEVVCEALLVLGRVLRPQDADRARASFRDAAEVAADAGLARWHLRAQQELALESWGTDGSGELLRTRELAAPTSRSRPWIWLWPTSRCPTSTPRDADEPLPRASPRADGTDSRPSRWRSCGGPAHTRSRAMTTRCRRRSMPRSRAIRTTLASWVTSTGGCSPPGPSSATSSTSCRACSTR
jgi:transcriptional regulator of met regulon